MQDVTLDGQVLLLLEPREAGIAVQTGNFQGRQVGALRVLAKLVSLFEGYNELVLALALYRPDASVWAPVVVTHLERFPRERAVAAVRHADYYGAYRYDTVKRILLQGLDLQQFPLAAVPEPGRPKGPYRFARRLGELLAQPLENTDDPH